MLSFKDLQTVDILFRLLYLIENKRFPNNNKSLLSSVVLIWSPGNYVKNYIELQCFDINTLYPSSCRTECHITMHSVIYDFSFQAISEH